MPRSAWIAALLLACESFNLIILGFKRFYLARYILVSVWSTILKAIFFVLNSSLCGDVRIGFRGRWGGFMVYGGFLTFYNVVWAIFNGLIVPSCATFVYDN